MKFKITKRDVKFFIAGVIAFLIFSFIWDWDNNVQAFKDGYNGARKIETNE